ncbi:unnamed protein product [Discosporangium mesarthrocarpum]
MLLGEAASSRVSAWRKDFTEDKYRDQLSPTRGCDASRSRDPMSTKAREGLPYWKLSRPRPRRKRSTGLADISNSREYAQALSSHFYLEGGDMDDPQASQSLPPCKTYPSPNRLRPIADLSPQVTPPCSPRATISSQPGVCMDKEIRGIPAKEYARQGSKVTTEFASTGRSSQKGDRSQMPRDPSTDEAEEREHPPVLPSSDPPDKARSPMQSSTEEPLTSAVVVGDHSRHDLSAPLPPSPCKSKPTELKFVHDVLVVDRGEGLCDTSVVRFPVEPGEVPTRSLRPVTAGETEFLARRFAPLRNEYFSKTPRPLCNSPSR